MTTCVFLLACATTSAGPEYSWKQTEHSLALMQADRTVWQFNYAGRSAKPYFHPLSIAGGQSLTDQRPPDHPWHHGLWFSWKYINGLNYWEEDAKTGKSEGETEITDVRVSREANHIARFELSLSYHPPGKPAVLLEKRQLAVEPPGPDGGYCIDWIGVFSALDAKVVLGRTPILGERGGVDWGGYAGLSLRLSPPLRKWQFADADGPVKGSGKPDRWLAFAGPLPGGRSATIAVFDHPKNPRHPSPWYVSEGMPYFSPALLYRGEYTLPAKGSLRLQYRLVLKPGLVDRAAVDRQYRQFAETHD